ncbi:cytochrome P450 83B1-like, partial [Trifolium medium]|nr:cytochrome P450 83B1-like [Trifolium medium]
MFAPVRKYEVTQMIKRISEQYASSNKAVNLHELLMGLTSA